MPCWWPSFQVNRIPYLPTGSTSVGRARALKIGSVPATGFSGSPGWRPSLSRSSWHNAQGQASRKKTKVYELRWPSFHSMSIPLPVVLLTLTDLGSATASIVLMSVAILEGPHSSIAEIGMLNHRAIRQRGRAAKLIDSQRHSFPGDRSMQDVRK